MHELPERPAGIPGSDLTGPWPVGVYAARLRERLRRASCASRSPSPAMWRAETANENDGEAVREPG